ncbi:hypothetical protein E2L08_09530 [Palleronia sediminis]|uniref:Isoprenylcysteine carboxylmethyltransferase family protein n=1 Tax=Palleronia sediminis TaxID=2547833 RepID=A0A4R6A9A3_9RHOB|nr:methyltransferase [Palleronia sediminis]TDL79537.1 hypothetical protein E2L08_09530 [Palleronia sediminis]
MRRATEIARARQAGVPPAPRAGHWFTAAWAWGLTVAIYVGLIRAGAAEWNALGWAAWLRWGIGGAVLTLMSFVVQGRGIVDAGLKGTSGWDAGLVTGGAYARRRHPQYAGQAISLIGLGILAAAPQVLAAAAAGVAALAPAGYAEDRALARRFGALHDVYRAQVRAFQARSRASPRVLGKSHASPRGSLTARRRLSPRPPPWSPASLHSAPGPARWRRIP